MRDYRWAGVAGIVLVALDLASFLIHFPGAPEANRSDTTILDWYTDSGNQARYMVGAILAGLAVVAFLVFLTGLRRFLADAGASPILTELAFVGGLMVAAVSFVAVAISSVVAATFVYSDTFELDPDTARIVLMIGNVWLIAIAGIPGSLFVGASCLAARRADALPAWLQWIGFAVAVMAVFAVPLFGVNLILVVLWVFLASLVFLRRSRGAR